MFRSKHKKIIICILLFFTINSASSLNSKKVLYVNSYHEGYLWSDDIEKEVIKNLNSNNLEIELKIIRMDTKRNKDIEYIKKAAFKVKKLIDDFKPDIVITSDDNAVKYLLVPYFNNSKIPFVFSGINGSAEAYNLSTSNVTGILEVQLVPEIINTLKAFAKNKKISYLRTDSFSSRKEGKYFEALLNQKIDKRYVTSVKQWKKEFLELQDSSGIMLLGNSFLLEEFNEVKDELILFVKENAKIPIGSWDKYHKEVSHLTFTTSAAEHGEWSSKTALEILNGKEIKEIKIVKNKKANIYINVTLSQKLGFTFPFDLMDNAILVE